MRDVLIVGAGPAGLTAAVYAARAGADVVVAEAVTHGGQAALAAEIENMPGFLRVGGMELGDLMHKQAELQGVEFRTGTATSLEPVTGGWRVHFKRDFIDARAVIAASGAARKKLDVPGESALTGKGVSYCAVCDGAFFRNQTVAVVGGGDTAVEDALHLSKLCAKVYLVHRRDSFRATATRVKKARETENIIFYLNKTVTSISGTPGNLVLLYKDVNKTGGLSLPVSAVFVAVGNKPNTEWLKEHVPLDDAGYALVDEGCKVAPGLYVAGDLRKKPLYQIVTACSDGAVCGKAATTRGV